MTGTDLKKYTLESQDLAMKAGEEERGKWDSKTEFYLSCIGYAVGFGNVWRFPFLCYKNGGAVFLIPYTLMLLLAGFPLFFMELAIGQYSCLGPNILFGKMAPIFKGLGYSMVMVSILITIYFNLIFAWSLFYLIASFSSYLPWSSCLNDFNSPYCYTKEDNVECHKDDLLYFNKTCISSDEFCLRGDTFPYNISFCIGSQNISDLIPIDSVLPRISSSEDYFTNRMLDVEGRSWDDMGSLRWELVGYLALAWAIIGVCMMKGVKSSGKVVYVTATAPYVVLIALLVRGLTLEGSYKGIEFYFLKPNLTKLTEMEVWNDAAIQIFYSLGSSAGVLVTLSSYNSFKNNCLRDAISIATCNCLTSVFAGFVIFSIVGFMATELDVEVKDVVESGSGLAFIAYPEAVSRMPFSSFWAVLFFLMLVTLGIDSQFSYMETIATALLDEFPSLRRKKALVTVIITFLLFLAGITMCLQGGVFMFELFVYNSAGMSLILIALAEILVIQYGYGFKRLIGNIRDEMEVHIPTPIYCYLYATWLFLTPLSLLILVVLSAYYYTPSYYGSYVFPQNIQVLGWCICLASIICIPIGALWAIFYSGKTWKEMFKSEDICSLPNSDRELLQTQPTESQKSKIENFTYLNNAFE